MDKKIPSREYNNRMVYYCFNNNFPADCGGPDLNLPPITIYDRPHLDKRARYIPDMLPDAISVDPENSVSTLNTPYYSPQLLVMTSDNPNYLHAMKKYEPYLGRVKRGYCSSKRDGTIY